MVQRAEVRRVLSGAALLLISGTGLANLFCAIAYGAVFLVRGGSDWTYWSDSPFAFALSVIVSLIVAPVGFLFGIVLVDLREDRRMRRELVSRALSQPASEDDAHIIALDERREAHSVERNLP